MVYVTRIYIPYMYTNHLYYDIVTSYMTFKAQVIYCDQLIKLFGYIDYFQQGISRIRTGLSLEVIFSATTLFFHGFKSLLQCFFYRINDIILITLYPPHKPCAVFQVCQIFVIVCILPIQISCHSPVKQVDICDHQHFRHHLLFDVCDGFKAVKFMEALLIAA